MPRTPLQQTFSMGTLGVTNVAQPIAALDLTSLTIAFMISNPSTNANSVFFGDVSVNTTNGIEITPGSSPLFTIDEERQLYEIQNPMMKLYEAAKCEAYPEPDYIPIICWNPSQIFLITTVAGPVNVGMVFFKNVYV